MSFCFGCTDNANCKRSVPLVRVLFTLKCERQTSIETLMVMINTIDDDDMYFRPECTQSKKRALGRLFQKSTASV